MVYSYPASSGLFPFSPIFGSSQAGMPEYSSPVSAFLLWATFSEKILIKSSYRFFAHPDALGSSTCFGFSHLPPIVMYDSVLSPGDPDAPSSPRPLEKSPRANVSSQN